MDGPDTIRLPEHWRELLRGSESEPKFFQFVMMIEDSATDVAKDEVAMEGVFSYHE